MRNQTPNLILECRNCRMKFQSKEQLSNHVAKFCKDSDYGSINRLQQKLEESKRSNKTANSATNIDELKSYFKGEYDVRNQNDIGSLSLEELRSKIRNNEREFEKVADHVLSAKEDDLRLDLLKLKYEKIESQAKRQYNETVFVDLMRELDSRMDREIRAQNERDQITLALRDLDRRNMGVGDAEKRRDLIRLENERDTLKNKEMEFLKDLENFKRWMQENERIWQAEKDRLNLETRGERVKINLELFQKRQMELAKERAMYINQMTEKRSGIELERQRIMDDLANLRKGDYGTIRKNSAGKLVGSSIVGTPVASSKFDNKALPAPVQRLNDKWQQDYEKLNNLKKEHQDYLQSNKSNPFDFRLEESRQNSLQNLNSPQYIQPATIRKPTQRTAIPSFGNNDLAPINNYIPMQPPLNNFPYNPMMPPQMLNPYQMNYGYNNPFALSLHQPPPQEDKANLALKKELKKIKKKLKNKDEDNFYVGMQNAIGVFQNKINDLERPNHPNQAISSEDLLPEERALNNVLNQEQADLKLLSALPRDSELYRAKMDHYKEMSQIRMRMEGMLQELSMQRMKKNFEREMENKERKLVNEKWMEEQKRGMIMSQLGFVPGQTNQAIGYVAEAGFYVFWDFVVGIPNRFRQTQIVYGLYEYGQSRLGPRLVSPVAVENDPFNEASCRAIFNLDHDIKDMTPSQSIYLIIEIQGIGDNQKVSNIGWTAFDIFTAQNALNEGIWKLPLYRPPTNVNVELNDIKNQTIVPYAFLFLRAVPVGSGSDLLRFTPNPDTNISEYKIPSSHVRSNYSQPQSRSLSDSPSNPQIKMSRESRNSRPGSLGTRGTALNPMSNQGFAIRLENLLNFLSKSHIRFQVTIQEDDKIATDSLGRECRWMSDVLNALATDVVAARGNRRIPGTKVFADKTNLKASDIEFNAMQNAGYRGSVETGHNIIEINKETQFSNNFYLSLEQANWQMNYYLVIEVFEKSSQGLAQGKSQGYNPHEHDGYAPQAWTVFQLSNQDTRSLNFGTVELNLYSYPITVPLYDPQLLRPRDGTLKVTIYEPTITRVSSVQNNPRPGSISSFKATKRVEPFVENQASQLDDIRYFEKGDGVDFYVDAARFLPDGVSATKIIVKAFTANLEKVDNPVGGLPDLNSSAYSPNFGFRTEFRKQIFDPTTTIVISILTVDTNHSEVRVLGYTAINMFMNKYRRDQPESQSEQDFILNKGCFQMPIYCQEPYKKPPFGVSAFKKLETIPCATLLIRIREAPKADNGLRVLSVKDVMANEWYVRGLVVPPPAYEDGAYNTSNCMPTTIERYLYEERANRRDVTVRDMTSQAQNQLGLKVDLNDEEYLDWIDQALQVTPRTPMIDMKYFSKYNPKLGFKISIDAIHNIPSETPHVAIFCLNPPAALYSNTVITRDVNFTTKVDWNSPIKTPTFLDGFHNYRNCLFDKCMHLIIDIRAVSYSKQRPEVEDVGWTILPIFSDDGYVNSGIYQLPVFKGKVPAPFMSELANNEPWKYLMKAASRSGGPQYYDPVSVIVRLVDAQRDGHFMTQLETQRMNYDFIPESMLSKMAYNAAAEERNTSETKLKMIVPGNFSPEAYLKKTNEAIADHLGLSHVVA